MLIAVRRNTSGGLPQYKTRVPAICTSSLTPAWRDWHVARSYTAGRVVRDSDRRLYNKIFSAGCGRIFEVHPPYAPTPLYDPCLLSQVWAE